MIYCVLYKDPIACLIRSLLSVTEGPQFSQMKRVGKKGKMKKVGKEKE